MMRTIALLALLAVACGGQTTDQDAGADAGGDGPISQCHGYCPQPNGATCTSDCDCFNKCIGGKCANATAPTVSCGDAAACPSGQTCDSFGTCTGATCKTTSDCPVEQQCMNAACAFAGCI